jgi:glycosyltransferase involved in cell wall biosynthesis
MRRPVPVLLAVRELTIGGCERDLTKIAKHLDRTRFTPHVACFHPNGMRGDELRSAGIPILHLPVTSFASRSALTGAWMLRRYIREHGIQVVHAFDVPTDIFVVPAARLSGVPAVIAAQLGYRDLFSPLYWRLLRFTDRLAHGIVVNSHAVQKHLIEDEKIPANLIHVIHNGVETETFFPQKGVAPDPRPQTPQGATLVIGSLCVLRKEKRLDLLMDAFARVRSLCPGMKLLIVGSGELLPEIEKQRQELGISEDCVLEPAKAEVVDYLRAMDIFVLSSDSESFPNALLEAMACGCCVIGSNVGGVPELIQDGENGLLFRTGDVNDLVAKLARVIQSRELRDRLGSSAARSARESFSMEIAVRKTESLYEELLTR